MSLCLLAQPLLSHAGQSACLVSGLDAVFREESRIFKTQKLANGKINTPVDIAIRQSNGNIGPAPRPRKYKLEKQGDVIRFTGVAKGKKVDFSFSAPLVDKAFPGASHALIEKAMQRFSGEDLQALDQYLKAVADKEALLAKSNGYFDKRKLLKSRKETEQFLKKWLGCL